MSSPVRMLASHTNNFNKGADYTRPDKWDTQNIMFHLMNKSLSNNLFFFPFLAFLLAMFVLCSRSY